MLPWRLEGDLIAQLMRGGLDTREFDEIDTSALSAADILGLEAALPRVVDTSGNRFRITVSGHDCDSRSDAAHALADWANNSEPKWAARYTTRDFGAIGRISSFDTRVTTPPGLGSLGVLVSLAEVPRSEFVMTKESFLEGRLGLIQRIENRVCGIPALLDQAREDVVKTQETITETDQRIGQPFCHGPSTASRMSAVTGSTRSAVTT